MTFLKYIIIILKFKFSSLIKRFLYPKLRTIANERSFGNTVYKYTLVKG